MFHKNPSRDALGACALFFWAWGLLAWALASPPGALAARSTSDKVLGSLSTVHDLRFQTFESNGLGICSTGSNIEGKHATLYLLRRGLLDLNLLRSLDLHPIRHEPNAIERFDNRLRSRLRSGLLSRRSRLLRRSLLPRLPPRPSSLRNKEMSNSWIETTQMLSLTCHPCLHPSPWMYPASPSPFPLDPLKPELLHPSLK